MKLILFIVTCIVIFTGLCAYGADELVTRMSDFIKARLPELMTQFHTPGACVSLIKNGEIVYSEGFGYADLGNKVTVDPHTTLFRAGSISKLFVWTAIMQLYEKGLVDLDADINTYLGEYKIPRAENLPGRKGNETICFPH